MEKTGCLFTVTCIKVRIWAFPKSVCVWGKRGASRGVRRDWSYRGGNWWCWRGGYLVPFETGAGRISYQGLFVAETLGLGDSGILRESPPAAPLKREHGEKFKGTQRWGDARRKAESSTEGGMKFRGRKKILWSTRVKTFKTVHYWENTGKRPYYLMKLIFKF